MVILLKQFLILFFTFSIVCAVTESQIKTYRTNVKSSPEKSLLKTEDFIKLEALHFKIHFFFRNFLSKTLKNGCLKIHKSVVAER